MELINRRPPRKSIFDSKYPELVRKRRRQIFSAAAKKFAEKGFYATTMQEIASEAGLGKGTLYEYVRSKKELLFLVLEEGHVMIFEKLDALRADKTMHPEEKWREALRIQMQMLDANSETARAILPVIKELETTDRELLESMRVDYLERYKLIYDECVAAGVFRKMDSLLVCEIACHCAFLWNDSITARQFSRHSREKFETILFEILNYGIKWPELKQENRPGTVGPRKREKF